MLLVGNGKLFTRGGVNVMISDGCVAIDGNKIKELGTTPELLAKYPGADYIDAKGGVIMPGLINAHDHIYSMFSRGISIKNYSPKNFTDILEGMWWTMDGNMNLEDTKWSGLSSFVSDIKNGVTTVFDHHASYGGTEGSLFALADAAATAGVRACLCYEVSDRAGETKMKAAVKENADFIKYCAGDHSDMIKGMMGLHASFTLSDASLALCRENTPENVGFHVHVAEGMADVYDSLGKYHKRVINRLHDNGILGGKTITGHCIHINGMEMDILKDTDTCVVHNPESNMGNAVGCPPSLMLVQKGIVCGLGTDGFISDMFQSMKMANAMHKHSLCDPTAAWGEVPQMLFANNAEIGARHFSSRLGVLEEGAAADIIVVDYDPPTPLDETNLNGHCLFGMMARDVSTTIINGVVRMKDKELVDIDEKEVFAKSREQAADFWKRINS